MRDYLSEEINLNEPTSKKHKNICNIYLASAVTGCISISDFASLFGILVGILSSADGLKICAITAEIKKKESILQKKIKHEKIVLLAKTKFNSIEVFISKAVNDSYITHSEFNMLKKYDNMKEEIKNPDSKYFRYNSKTNNI